MKVPQLLMNSQVRGNAVSELCKVLVPGDEGIGAALLRHKVKQALGLRSRLTVHEKHFIFSPDAPSDSRTRS